MAEMILYHGSLDLIKKPVFGYGKTNNDYGPGFYCTQNLEMAKEWAAQDPEKDGWANEYSIEIDGLKLLNLNGSEYTILNWLSVLAKYRDFRVSTPIARQGKNYLIENFSVPVENYDMIMGYRADDSYFSFARAFVNNELSIAQLANAMKLGKLGEQYVLKSQKAFDKIQFKEAHRSLAKEYFSKRKDRNEAANQAFRKEAENVDLNEIFMRDILREKIKNDDERLR
jgi:hypothetical protein